MAGPGKGASKRFGVQNSSRNYDVRQPHKSSSDVPQPRQLNSNVPQPHQSSRLHYASQPQKLSGRNLLPEDSNNRHGAPQSKNSVSRHDGSQPHKSGGHDIHPHSSNTIHGVPQPYKSINKSIGTNDVPYHQGCHKGQTSFRLQDSNVQFHETTQDYSPCISRVRWVPQTENEVNSLQIENEVNSPQTEEIQREDGHEVNSPQTDSDTSDSEPGENIDSTSHGTFDTRTQSRTLGETKKRRLSKGKLIFEVDEYDRRIIGDDSQRFITKGGCVMRKFAKFDGTTWRNQDDTLKRDIIKKCVENSTYDSNCPLMVHAIHSQLANQHRSKQHRLHRYYQKFSTHEDATRHPPDGIRPTDWVSLCQKFASVEFQKLSDKNKKNSSMNAVPPAVGTVSIARIVDMKRREGEDISTIEKYKIGHFSKKKNKMVNQKADEILKDLLHEEASSTSSPVEICMKILHHIPGHAKGRSVSTKKVLATENLRMELELEKERSKALEEQLHVVTQKQMKYEENQIVMMAELSRLSRLQSQNSLI